VTLEELEKRVRVLEDIEEIKQLHRNYIFWLSNTQLEEILGCFAEKATVKIGAHEEVHGKPAYARQLSGILGGMRPKGGHMLVQPVVTVDGDRAQGYWIMNRFFYHDFAEPDGPKLKWLEGRYDCEYVREGGKWKFSLLKWTSPWPVKDTP
jgi:hypothetical protein